MYMPGHAAMTSLFFLVFGDSPAAALSVNILSYIACIVLIYLIGRRIRSSRTGVVAALLFAVFPIVVIYACTAMAEMTLLFVCLAALAVFAHLRHGVRVWLAPVLLTVPFLFRETAALWIIPMAAIDWELGDFDLLTGLKRSLTMAALSFVLLSSIFLSPWISDRPTLIRQNLLGVTLADKYLNAFSVPEEALTVSEWARASLHHAARNLGELAGLVLHQPTSLESVTLVSLLLALSVLPFVAQSRMRPVRIALLCLGLVLLALLAFVYRFVTYIGVRHLLLVLPLAVILAAVTLEPSHWNACASIPGSISLLCRYLYRWRWEG